MASRSTHSPGPAGVKVPDGAPPWVRAELLADTLQTWRPHYGGQLTTEEALEILTGVGRLLDLLGNDDG